MDKNDQRHFFNTFLAIVAVIVIIGIIYLILSWWSDSKPEVKSAFPLEKPAIELEKPAISNQMPLLECSKTLPCDCKTLEMTPGRFCTGKTHTANNKNTQLCYKVRTGDDPFIQSRGNMLCDSQKCKDARAVCQYQPSCQSFGKHCGAGIVATL